MRTNFITFIKHHLSIFLLACLPILAFSETIDEVEDLKDISNLQQKLATKDSDTRKAVDKLFYSICVREMIEGMKEGMDEGTDAKATQRLLNDPEILANMREMAEKICSCAAPKFVEVVVKSLDKPEAELGDEFYDKEALKAIMSCM
jgi:hypothetical protein